MTATLAEGLRKFSVEEYFELEKQSDVKHEYYYGKLIPMPGESKNVNLINGNLKLHWTRPLREKGFHTFDHDVKVTVKSGVIYRYPDFAVAPKSDNVHEYLIMEPVLLAEIASEGSWHTDSFIKLREYLALPSLLYYLIISQDEMHVEVCSLENKKWTVAILTKPAEVIQLPFFDLKLSLAELYEEVQFAET